MLDLDFAFFNMHDSTRQGLAKRKPFLDRLAPYLFPPRVEQLIKFRQMGLQGCNVRLPLGEENWSLLNEENRGLMLEKTATILNQYEITRLGVDRRLKGVLQWKASQPFVFGDQFISVLAAVLIDQTLSRHAIKKLILAGKIPHIEPLIKYIAHHNIPISIQNYQPAKYEVMAYRLLYEEGLAVSNSFLKPHSWEKGDLIILVDSQTKSLGLAAPQAFYIRLDDQQTDLAPELEHILQVAGLAPRMHTLAPILETCLLTQAGETTQNEEINESSEDTQLARPYRKIIDAGFSLGLWDPFLDKGASCLYNYCIDDR